MKIVTTSAGLVLALLATTSGAEEFNYSENASEKIARGFVEQSVNDSFKLPTSFNNDDDQTLTPSDLANSNILYSFSYDAENPTESQLAGIDSLDVNAYFDDIYHMQDCEEVKEKANLSSNENNALTSFTCAGDENINAGYVAQSTAGSGDELVVNLSNVEVGTERVDYIIHHVNNYSYEVINYSSDHRNRYSERGSDYIHCTREGIIQEAAAPVPGRNENAGINYVKQESCDQYFDSGPDPDTYCRHIVKEEWDTEEVRYDSHYSDLTLNINHSIAASPTYLESAPASPNADTDMTYELNSTTSVEWLSGVKDVWVPIQVGDITTFVQAQVNEYSTASTSTNFSINNLEVTHPRAGSEIMALIEDAMPEVRSGESLSNIDMKSLTNLSLGCANSAYSIPFTPQYSGINNSLDGIGGNFDNVSGESLDQLLDECNGLVNVFADKLITSDQSDGYISVEAKVANIEESDYWSKYGETLLANLLESKDVYQSFDELLKAAAAGNITWQTHIQAYSAQLRSTIRSKLLNGLLLDRKAFGLTDAPSNDSELINYVDEKVATIFVSQADVDNDDPDNQFYDLGMDTWLGLLKPGAGTSDNVMANPDWLLNLKDSDKALALKAELIAYAFNNYGFDDLDNDGLLLGGYLASLQNEMGKTQYFLGLAATKLAALSDAEAELAALIEGMRDESLEGSLAYVLSDSEILVD